MNWAQIIDGFNACKVLVVGDICLDRWCRYDPAEADISRETGIARIGVIGTEVTPGAGGTVANNVAALGAGQVSVLGAIGQDGFGFELERALAERRIEYNLLVASQRMQTFTYTKLINDATGVEDKPRVDQINTRTLPDEVEDQLIANFHSAYKDFDIILVADQAETNYGGVVSPGLREMICDVAERNPKKIVIVDSRNRIELFRNVIAKPNQQEADRACRKSIGMIDYTRLMKVIGTRPLVITQGASGAMLVNENGEKQIPAPLTEQPIDTCGAGDSFAAGLSLAFHVTGDIETAVRLGLLVSGITIMKKGTGTASPAEVLEKAESLAQSA
ncbi:MAG: PfkB family carbohydrate kinase [Bryobacterales bacterium]